LASHRAVSSAKPAGSRVRVISAANRFGVAVVSSQARPGRITSAHISDSRPVPSTAASNRQSNDVLALRHRIGKPLQSMRPSRSAPLASQRCCQVSPGWVCSQSTTIRTPRLRLSSPAGVSTTNGAVASRCSTDGRDSLVCGQEAVSRRAGNLFLSVSDRVPARPAAAGGADPVIS
jgi:hypothetical protein